MHKRPKMLEVHERGSQGIPRVHDLHVCGAQLAFLELSGMHDLHVCGAQCVSPTCKTCIRVAPVRTRHARPGRRPDSDVFTDIQKRNLPYARQFNGPLGGGPSPSHTVGPGSRRLCEKHSDQQRVGRLIMSSHSTIYHTSRMDKKVLGQDIENQ